MTGSSQTIRALRCCSILEPEKFGWLNGPFGPVAEILASRQIPFVFVSGYSTGADFAKCLFCRSYPRWKDGSPSKRCFASVGAANRTGRPTERPELGSKLRRCQPPFGLQLSIGLPEASAMQSLPPVLPPLLLVVAEPALLGDPELPLVPFAPLPELEPELEGEPPAPDEPLAPAAPVPAAAPAA
jgi:hypothetical protein